MLTKEIPVTDEQVAPTKRTAYPVLPKGYTERGSQMGRADTIEEPDEPIKFRLYKMPMSSCGCYDSGGAYWGAGRYETGYTYHAYGEGPESLNEMFIRAVSRAAAKSAVLREFKHATFYR